jgi:hypothetical protein
MNIKQAATLLTIFITSAIFASCNQNKPKPVSKNLTKTAVLINNKKDSVINNPKKNYGNATIAEPCIRCLIQAVQTNEYYKNSIRDIPAKNLLYVANWVTTGNVSDSSNSKSATSGLKLDVTDKSSSNKKLASFIYDNSLLRLYYLQGNSFDKKLQVNVRDFSLKRIRNACYWGVASGK